MFGVTSVKVRESASLGACCGWAASEAAADEEEEEDEDGAGSAMANDLDSTWTRGDERKTKNGKLQHNEEKSLCEKHVHQCLTRNTF